MSGESWKGISSIQYYDLHSFVRFLIHQYLVDAISLLHCVMVSWLKEIKLAPISGQLSSRCATNLAEVVTADKVDVETVGGIGDCDLGAVAGIRAVGDSSGPAGFAASACTCAQDLSITSSTATQDGENGGNLPFW